MSFWIRRTYNTRTPRLPAAPANNTYVPVHRQGSQQFRRTAFLVRVADDGRDSFHTTATFARTPAPLGPHCNRCVVLGVKSYHTRCIQRMETPSSG